jgi:hypothetical protein
MPFVKRNNGEESKAPERAMSDLTVEVHYRSMDRGGYPNCFDSVRRVETELDRKAERQLPPRNRRSLPST